MYVLCVYNPALAAKSNKPLLLLLLLLLLYNGKILNTDTDIAIFQNTDTYTEQT